MSRHHEKLIAALTAPEPKEPRREPRNRHEIESVIRGFGITGSAVRTMANLWESDVHLARSQGYNDGYEEASEYF